MLNKPPLEARGRSQRRGQGKALAIADLCLTKTARRRAGDEREFSPSH